MAVVSIQVYEHESLKIGDMGFTPKHLELLSKYLGDKEGDDFPYYSLINRGVQFKQYVGVISVENLHIEVLPKTDKNTGEKDKAIWESHLLEMLRVVYKMKVNLPSKADQQMKRSHVLDVFIDHFLDEVEHILHIGLVKAYRRVEDNRTSLKGRLVMSKHIIKNIVHKERFYVDYTTYDRNHILNRILYKALRVIPDIAASSYTISRAKTLMFEFPELNDILVNESLFNRISFDRKTEDYRNAVDLARMILLNYMPNMTYRHSNNVLALMFDMNKLWEEYVYVILRRRLTNFRVQAQNTQRFWHSDIVGDKTIRPDIVIRNKETNDCVAVLDTKWKCPHDGKPSDADLKQMYAYHKYWNTKNTALLYPGDKASITGYFTKDCEKCHMLYLPINKEGGAKLLNIEKLVEFIEKNS